MHPTCVYVPRGERGVCVCVCGGGGRTGKGIVLGCAPKKQPRKKPETDSDEGE